MRAGLDNIYQRLETWGYPRVAIDWLRGHRLVAIIGLAIACWALVLGVGWLAFGLVWWLVSQIGALF